MAKTDTTTETVEAPVKAKDMWVLPTSICRGCADNGDGSLEGCGTRFIYSKQADNGIDAAQNIQGCSSFQKVEG